MKFTAVEFICTTLNTANDKFYFYKKFAGLAQFAKPLEVNLHKTTALNFRTKHRERQLRIYGFGARLRNKPTTKKESLCIDRKGKLTPIEIT